MVRGCVVRGVMDRRVMSRVVMLSRVMMNGMMNGTVMALRHGEPCHRQEYDPNHKEFFHIRNF